MLAPLKMLQLLGDSVLQTPYRALPLEPRGNFVPLPQWIHHHSPINC